MIPEIAIRITFPYQPIFDRKKGRHFWLSRNPSAKYRLFFGFFRARSCLSAAATSAS